jgi:hypothetical protein
MNLHGNRLARARLWLPSELQREEDLHHLSSSDSRRRRKFGFPAHHYGACLELSREEARIADRARAQGSPYVCFQMGLDASGFGLDFVLGCKYTKMHPKTSGIQSNRVPEGTRRLDCMPKFWAVGKIFSWSNPKFELDPAFSTPVGMLLYNSIFY